MSPKVAKQIDLFLEKIEILKIQIKTYCNKKLYLTILKNMRVILDFQGFKDKKKQIYS